jgi:hypothetical protein
MYAMSRRDEVCNPYVFDMASIDIPIKNASKSIGIVAISNGSNAMKSG